MQGLRARQPASGDGGDPAIRGQPRLPRPCRIVPPGQDSDLEEFSHNPTDGVPLQSNSPPGTVPGAGRARRLGRALGARSESPLGLAPHLTRRIPLVRTSSKSAAGRQPRRGAARNRGRGPDPTGGAAEPGGKGTRPDRPTATPRAAGSPATPGGRRARRGMPTPAGLPGGGRNSRRSWGDPQEGPGSRPESPPPPAPGCPGGLHAGERAAAPPPAPRRPAPGEEERGREGRGERAEGGRAGRGWGGDGPAGRPGVWGGQRRLVHPRRGPSPASRPSTSDPALRANPYPEVMDLACHLSLPPSFSCIPKQPDSGKARTRHARGRYQPHTVHGLGLDQKDLCPPRAAPGSGPSVCHISCAPPRSGDSALGSSLFTRRY
ncbi:basic salivary proline-rich protein 2-like [Equus quagga]|uniref:basic salivary proline-rich protein 2-like n=1 Tax=Equus quagga TaxID=89248 RepID=UPI001EE3778F|nr:basic salivary proline-rich protein 2-like [Equus quagga]